MLLTSPRAKFERAQVHRQAFLEAALAWLELHQSRPSPLEKRVRNDANDVETHTWHVGKADLPVDLNLSLLLGDAIFNYRAALDHVAWMAAKPKSSRERGGVYFPIVSLKDDWETDFAKKMPGAPDAVKALIRTHQPFLNGEQWRDHPLSVLTKWNNDDKHKVLHIVAAGTQHVNFKQLGDWANFEVLATDYAEPRIDMAPGTELVRVVGRRRDRSKDPGIRYVVQAQLTAMDDSGRVLEFWLTRINDAVDSVLSDFERQP